MGDKTAIEWTDATWNPLVGCTRCSPACDHCYAIGVVHRGLAEQHVGLTIRRPGEHPPGERLDWTGEVRTVPHLLDQPLRWQRPRRIFVNSLSDVFHAEVEVDFIVDLFAVMSLASQHTFQVLTKRPGRARVVLSSPTFPDLVAAACERIRPGADSMIWPIPNVWLGTTIESNRYAWRMNQIANTPAAVRFVSAEPLLGPLDALDMGELDWLIIGGESGPGARPMHPEWARALIVEAERLGVPIMFKQWGDWVPYTGREGALEVRRDVNMLRLPEPDGRLVEMTSGWEFPPNTRHPNYPDGVDGALSHFARVGKHVAGRLFPSHPADGGRTYDGFP